MTIIVISEPNDVHAQSVIKALPKFTADEVVLLNFQNFPTRMHLDQHLPSQGKDHFAITLDNGRRLPIDEVRSVWWRRPQAYVVPVQGMEPHARQFALSETATAFQGMWQCTECLWVNDIIRDAAASHKPWQLHLAKQAGLRIPDTVITNNPTQARSFWDHCQGEVIYKPFIQTFHSWRETRKLKRNELSMLDSVKWAPVIFQRLIPGVADLRVTIG